MQWIYLSPHLDDAALSCGGLVWEQTQAGDHVQIWTICAGDPPDGPLSPFAQSLHIRWQTGRNAIAIRRQEDLLSCQRLYAKARHFAVPDCIYRKPVRQTAGSEQAEYLYTTEQSLFGPVHPAEEILIQEIATKISQEMRTQPKLVCPLALGGHVDHRLVRKAAESLGRDLFYYADYPYLRKTATEIEQLIACGWRQLRHPISPEGLAAWQDSVAAHQSQISTFWPDENAMKLALESDLARLGGLYLWKNPPN